MAQEPGAGTEGVLDIAMLTRQTQGNRALEREVLGLFLDHSVRLFDQLKAAETVAERRQVAHGLAGSALAIGANRTAAAARKIEHSDQKLSADVVALEAALAQARRLIAEHLAE